MKIIRTIIFDLGAVLLNINYKKTIIEFEKLGIKDASTFYSKESQRNVFDLLETGKISEKEFINQLAGETKNGSAKEIIFAWNAMLLDLPKKRINLLQSLQEKYTLFLLSNTNSIHISEFKKRLGAEQYNMFYNLFKKVYYSHEIGLRKPHAETFSLILNEYKLKPKEVLFIDDSPQHIEGAKELGLYTHHLIDSEEVSTLFPDITL